MNNRVRTTFASAGIMLAVCGVGAAEATTYTFTDGASASGSINTTTGVVTITNAFANTGSAADEISGLQIIFSTTPGAAPTLSSSAGQLISIDSAAHTGTFVAGAIDHWGTSEVGSTLYLATAGTGSQPAQPYDLIIGPGTGSSSPYTYSNANSSTDVHSPSIWETGTFTLAGLSGLIITGVKIEFGTTPDSVTGLLSCRDLSCTGGGGQGGETPLPAALPLFATGLGGLGLLGWRRKRKNAGTRAA